MDLFIFLTLALVALWVHKSRQQRRRILILAGFLSRFRIEKAMETLIQGYLRALGEADEVRRDQVFQLLRGTEQELCAQLRRLVADARTAAPGLTRVSRLPIWLPFAPTLLPSFDMREALRIHAEGICAAIEREDGASARDRAFCICAELFLLQHTCHWFCRSRLVASARMLSLHRTSHEQLVAAVLPRTRSAYLALIGA